MTPLEQVELAARAAADKKASDVVLLEVRDLVAITDYFLICAGGSDRQVKTISDEVVKRLKDRGVRPLRIEGANEARWVLLDYEDFIVHVFLEEDRRYYDLERLWKDAPRIAVLGAEEATG